MIWRVLTHRTDPPRNFCAFQTSLKFGLLVYTTAALCNVFCLVILFDFSKWNRIEPFVRFAEYLIYDIWKAVSFVVKSTGNVNIQNRFLAFIDIIAMLLNEATLLSLWRVKTLQILVEFFPFFNELLNLLPEGFISNSKTR